MKSLNTLKKTTSFERIVFYLSIISLLPLLFLIYFSYETQKKWIVLTDEIQNVKLLAEKKVKKEQTNRLLKTKFSSSDKSYLEKISQNFVPLKKEIATLEQIIKDPAFTGNSSLESRFYKLTETNRLHFKQEGRHLNEGFEETVYSLFPLEIDTDDLKELLMHFEEDIPGKPQIVLTDFKIEKKVKTEGNEIFELNMKFLEREFAN